jgi:HD-like signal output (HDOD) protein/ActR/RegA family two-component response regulator
MTKILFVDDEQNVLQGLQRMLHSMRGEWSMSFANNGQDALDILAQDHFDVIVSDMRMPGMDGLKLLTEVKNRHPQVMRIILSGQSKHENILPSIGLAHQYLSKPCDSEQIKITVARACALRDLLTSPTLQGLVSHVGTLPSLPSLHAKVLQELQSEECSLQKIGETVSQDVGMTAKLLQLVNSSFFGLPHRVSSATEAVLFLGVETVRSLMISLHAFAEHDRRVPAGFSLSELWRHSMGVGILARDIARAETSDERIMNDACTAGLLHDVGKMVLASALPRKYSQAVAFARRNQCPLWEAERTVFGSTHAEVGAYLLGLWGLPGPIVEAVAFHHRPMECLSREFCALTAVHFANAIDNARNGAEPLWSQEYLEDNDLAEKVETWKALHHDMLTRSEPIQKAS